MSPGGKVLDRDDQGNRLFDARDEKRIMDGFYDAVCMMRQLRRNCPWDARQTADSLKRYVIEEAYEVVHAIEAEDWDDLKKELGDYLFQVLFQAELQCEARRFDVADVLAALVEKMVRRHPHVFGDAQNLGVEEIKRNWQDIKRAETGDKHASVFSGFPHNLPSLLGAYKIGRKTEPQGFDWETPSQVLDKVREEIAELDTELNSGNRHRAKEEMGDLLFTLAQLARKLDIEPEESLRKANAKFMRRFDAMESIARQRGHHFSDLTHPQKESLWAEVKALERRKP